MPLYLYERPHPEGAYVMGLDPAGGGGGGDAAALVVMDAGVRPARQVALFRSVAASYRDLGQLTHDLHEGGYRIVRGSLVKGYELSGGLVPEVNGANVAMTDVLHDYFEDEYFYQQRQPGTPPNPAGAIRRFGFLTTGGSKTLLLDELREALECRAFQQCDGFLGLEALYWDRQGGKWDFKPPVIASGDLGHGDVTIATALALEGVGAVQEWLEVRRERAARSRTPQPVRFYVQRPGLENARPSVLERIA